jgi:hypothetical protein
VAQQLGLRVHCRPRAWDSLATEIPECTGCLRDTIANTLEASSNTAGCTVEAEGPQLDITAHTNA